MNFKKIKNMLTIGLIVASMTVLVGCDQKDSTNSNNNENNTIVFAIPSDPDTINPAFTNVREATAVSNIMYSPLYTYKKGEITYYLADNIDFNNNKELIITLKKDLKWHDGQPITSDDILFTINTILDEKQNSSQRETLLIEGQPVAAEKIDNLTTKVTLPVPSSSFLYSMSKLTPIPKHIYEGEDSIAKSEKNNEPIGSGPFKFKEWKKGEKIIFEKYNDYFNGSPKANKIAVKIIPNEASQEAALNNGEITFMKGSVELFDKAKNNKNFQTYTYSEDRLNYMVFNQNKDYMKNDKFRKAISYALDRKEMIKSAYGSTDSQEAKSILVPGADFYAEENVEGYDHNIDTAKKLLAESGVNIDKLKIAYNTGRFAHKNYALVAQQQLKDIGIDAEVVPYESKAFFKVLFSDNTDNDILVNGYAWGLEPNPYRGMYQTGRFHNQTNYSNEVVDSLWEKGAEELDTEKRKNIYIKLQQLISQDAPVYTIDYEQNLMIANKNLKGIDDAKPISANMFEDWSKLYIE